ncbi:MAG: hypothetical protein H6815_04050 [Phycisphaeraceae bacterium]|nr:hypothetical protein [Phycisphaerales bacterium]MCB9859603.1 hypothetical protein [Phycisphaeraceae bacterium]
MSDGRARQHVRTIIIVTIVTLFIWVYAESESLRRVSRDVTIRVVAPTDHTKIVWLDPNRQTSTDVTLSLQGSTAALDMMRSRLTAPIELTPGEIGVPASVGTHDLLLRDVLRQLPRFERAGVTLDSVQPPSLSMHIEELVPVQATVRVQLPAGISATVNVTPPTVTIHVPQRLAKTLGDEPTITAQVPVERIPNTIGDAVLNGVRLIAPTSIAADVAQGFARIDPPAVDLGVKVREKTTTETINQVPIQLGVPADALDEYKVEFVSANYLTDVRVTGSPEAIAQLKQRTGSISLFAYVPLLYDDLREGEIDGTIVFGNLQIEGVRIESNTPTVRLRVTKREPASGEGEEPNGAAPNASEPPPS